MKTIMLSGGKKAYVSDEDYELVNKWKWQFNYNGYASRQHWNGKKYVKMYMHRYIMNTPSGKDTDHINRNKLDNQRHNLRIVDRSTNNHNTTPHKNNTSGYKGVSWFKPAKLWRAYIKRYGEKRIELGYFKTREEAISARLTAEQELGL